VFLHNTFCGYGLWYDWDWAGLIRNNSIDYFVKCSDNVTMPIHFLFPSHEAVTKLLWHTGHLCCVDDTYSLLSFLCCWSCVREFHD